ncbi:hypothetical protein CAPTEDRAFT_199255, partial [Capitella teleta]
CPTNHWGANCTECHCLNGPTECEALTGICTDYQCDRGWTDTPYCQTACLENTWGINCAKECHCLSGVICDRINGVCNGSCNIEWSGPSCQTREYAIVSQSINNSAWSELIIVTVSDPDQQDFHFLLANANPYTYYSFRIIANRREYGKPEEGLPGPASNPLRPLELCIGLLPNCRHC